MTSLAHADGGNRLAIIGHGMRHDAELRAKILAEKPDWQDVVKAMCIEEGKSILMGDTIALFYGRCDNHDLTNQIKAMVASRSPAIRRDPPIR